MTQTILNGGARTSQDKYVGQKNEITSDESNQELRLHDGSTPGGKRIPNIDTIDSRYQQRNEELDGFNFDPNQKGFLARVAAGAYRLRKWMVSDDLTLINADGVKGNPTFGLAATLTGDRKFVGNVEISEQLKVDDGIFADLTGDTAGTHTGPQVGDVDVRTHTLRLDDGQIPQAAVNGLVAALAEILVPVGSIVLWAGTVADIPTHWVLCDGTNGTPDLRGRFIEGATDDTDIGVIGGAATHLHVVTTESAGTHRHVVNVESTTLGIEQIPQHKHLNGATDNNDPGVFNRGTGPASPTTVSGIASIDDVNKKQNGATGIVEGYTETVGGGQPHGHNASSQDTGAHTHLVDIESGNNIPPYMCLAYIMKIN